MLVVGLVLRLGADWWWQSRLPTGERFFFGDSQTYWAAAQTIVRGEPYSAGWPESRVFRMPGYPLLLAALMRVVGQDASVLWARGLSAIFGTLSIGGVYWVAHQLFGRRTAVIAALLVAIYPEAVITGAWVLSEAPFTAAMTLQLALCAGAWRRAQFTETSGALPQPPFLAPSQTYLAWALAAGICGGVATFMRPSWLLFTPLAALLAACFAVKSPRQWLLALSLIVGFVIPMAPWWYRNAKVTGHFVPTTLQVGASLYDGWNSRASGGSDMGFVRPETAAARTAYDTSPVAQRESFEYYLDRWLRMKAVRWAAEHPYDALRLSGVKFMRMWSPWPNAPEFRGLLARGLVAACYVPLLLAGLIGAWRFSRRGWPYVLMWLPAAYLTLMHMVFVGSLRYREPGMVALAVLAGGLFTDMNSFNPRVAGATAQIDSSTSPE